MLTRPGSAAWKPSTNPSARCLTLASASAWSRNSRNDRSGPSVGIFENNASICSQNSPACSHLPSRCSQNAPSTSTTEKTELLHQIKSFFRAAVNELGAQFNRVAQSVVSVDPPTDARPRFHERHTHSGGTKITCRGQAGDAGADHDHIERLCHRVLLTGFPNSGNGKG